MICWFRRSTAATHSLRLCAAWDSSLRSFSACDSINSLSDSTNDLRTITRFRSLLHHCSVRRWFRPSGIAHGNTATRTALSGWRRRPAVATWPGSRLTVDSGVFNTDLMANRPEVGAVWAKSRLRDRNPNTGIQRNPDTGIQTPESRHPQNSSRIQGSQESSKGSGERAIESPRENGSLKAPGDVLVSVGRSWTVRPWQDLYAPNALSGMTRSIIRTWKSRHDRSGSRSGSVRKTESFRYPTTTAWRSDSIARSSSARPSAAVIPDPGLEPRPASKAQTQAKL